MNDDDLKKLLSAWQASPAPDALDARVLASYRESARPRRRWRWLFTGTLRVPVPVAALVLAAFAALSFAALRGVPRERPPERAAQQVVQITKITDFKPVAVLQPRIVRRSHVQQN